MLAWSADSTWKPTRLREVADSVDTSTGCTEVTTDAGRAYLKPMGNRQGPHVLATDWVGTHLARWFGLTTPDVAILHLDEEDAFPLPRGHTAEPGPAFASRALAGEPWGNSGPQLGQIDNPEDVTRLVVFDTWTLNCDRHHPDGTVRKPNYDNVFLSRSGMPPGRRHLVALDHGLCFIRSGEDLTPRLKEIDKVKAEGIWGLFPEFRSRLRAETLDACRSRLTQMNPEIARDVISTVPTEWEVSDATRSAWVELVSRRAAFVADALPAWIEKAAPWFGSEEF